MKSAWLLIAILLFAGCRSKQPSSTDKAGAETQAISAHSGMGQPGSGANILKGKVLEKLDVAEYTYLRLATASGETWAAVLKTDAVSVGAEAAVVNPMSMDGFESKTLKRKFEKIVFGTLDQNVQNSEAIKALRQAHAGVSSSAGPEPIKLEKAGGPEGRTVAEVFAQKWNLRDRKVSLRGRVVKVNAKVMERTWIHLRDGSGSRESMTDDITVTTQGMASVGDIVLVKGTVRTDKNFGMGYSFPVMIEDATITKQ